MNVAYNKETDFLKTYVALLNRLSPFENKTDFETIKTVTNAKALLRRAELIFAGAKPDGKFINYFCTKRKTAGGGEEMCIGIAESDNLMDWQDKTTFRLSGMLNAPESPFVLERGGKYYFFYTNCGLGTCYAISDNPYGGFIEAGELMVNKDCFGEAFVPSCAEVFRFKGQWYITVAERLPGNEQYIEIKKLVWQSEKCFVENNL